MSAALPARAPAVGIVAPDYAALLDALPGAVVVVAGPDNRFRYVNTAAEHVLAAGAAWLEGRPLDEQVPDDSPLFRLIGQTRAQRGPVSESGVVLSGPRIDEQVMNIRAAPVADGGDEVIILFQPRSIARRIDRQLVHRHAARSVSAMAAVMAHEVRNPLSGIRGAAQLLEESVAGPEDRELARLIREETDRIGALIDDMEVFADSPPLCRAPVNIHEVLDRVRRLIKAGAGRHIDLVEDYDPSLPAVDGNRDQLVQVFLNLVKNACEAAPERGGRIRIGTAFRSGVRLAVPGRDTRVTLPLEVTIEDNGQGISEDLRGHLFDPFVSTRREGRGLGLALVARIIDDHGGVIEFDSVPRRTVFRVMLPTASGEAAP